jgi:hypothetical protein
MIKDFVPPTRVEECRNTAEILRELAAQLRFAETRDLLVGLAEDLDWRASVFERRPNLPIGWVDLRWEGEGP